MRVLVTGGAGFIGSHLVDYLVDRGDVVVVLDDFSSGRKENLAQHRGEPRVSIVEGSILDCDLVDNLMSGCTSVFHLAAAVGVALINEQPLRSLRVNLVGCEFVLESAVRHQASVLLASTSEVYGKNYDVPLREDADRVMGSAWKSRWSYAEAKALDELTAHCLWRSAGLQVATVRLFNTVGARQTGRYGMVLPRFVGQALNGEDLTVYGDGFQRRCFADVRDVVPAIVAVAATPAAQGRAVNIGGQEEVTIRELANRVIKVTGSRSRVEYVPYEAAYQPGFEEIRRRVPDVGLARQLIDFEPRFSLDQIIATVVDTRRGATVDSAPGVRGTAAWR